MGLMDLIDKLSEKLNKWRWTVIGKYIKYPMHRRLLRVNQSFHTVAAILPGYDHVGYEHNNTCLNSTGSCMYCSIVVICIIVLISILASIPLIAFGKNFALYSFDNDCIKNWAENDYIFTSNFNSHVHLIIVIIVQVFEGLPTSRNVPLVLYTLWMLSTS